MSLSEFLFLQRAYSILALLEDRIGDYLGTYVYSSIDNDEVVANQRVLLKIMLTNGFQILIYERYEITHYQLVIAQYNYALYDESREVIFSFDNAPHHPELVTFPHHKHLYPKEAFKPKPFSGRFEDFLDEVVWELGRHVTQG